MEGESIHVYHAHIGAYIPIESLSETIPQEHQIFVLSTGLPAQRNQLHEVPSEQQIYAYDHRMFRLGDNTDYHPLPLSTTWDHITVMIAALKCAAMSLHLVRDALEAVEPDVERTVTKYHPFADSFASLDDVERLAIEHAEQYAHNITEGYLRTLQQSMHAYYMKSSHALQISFLRLSLLEAEQQAQSLDHELQAARTQHANELQIKEVELQEAKREMDRTYQTETARLTEELRATTQKLNEDHACELQQAQQAHQNSLAQLQAEHTQRLSAVEQERDAYLGQIQHNEAQFNKEREQFKYLFENAVHCLEAANISLYRSNFLASGVPACIHKRSSPIATGSPLLFIAESKFRELYPMHSAVTMAYNAYDNRSRVFVLLTPEFLQYLETISKTGTLPQVPPVLDILDLNNGEFKEQISRVDHYVVLKYVMTTAANEWINIINAEL
eukprot:gnl/Trimastix_PCT/1431.p1 GENE.gnl/Trimastix_PCT/1431~~gnl/Trimastix_PCT/1431.p1  ORF type:complete len:444 (-),score=105.64 gnl/Trimastix_PCT/1431:152-1483(-)